MNYSAKDYAYTARIRVRAFTLIADKLGKNHEITKMMGSLSYGRHRWERGPDRQGLRDCATEFGFLCGFFDCLSLWARDHDPNAQRIMLELMPSGMATEERGAAAFIGSRDAPKREKS